MKSNVKSFLNSLEELNNTNTIKVNVPSQNKNIDFKLPSVTQQRALMSSAFDGTDKIVKRSNAFNNIVQENCMEDIDFLITDRSSILIDIRKAVKGNKYVSNDKEYDLDELVPINMNDLELTRQIVEDNITVNLCIPSLNIDTVINKKIQGELSTVKDKEQHTNIGKRVELVLSYELCKYITDISVGGEQITFSDISVYERNKIINSLPLSINNKIIDYVGEIKKVIDNSLTLSPEVVVEIGASFLSTD